MVHTSHNNIQRPRAQDPWRTIAGTTATPPEKSRGESQGNHPVTTVQKPQGAAAMNSQAPLVAIFVRADPAMYPETRDTSLLKQRPEKAQGSRPRHATTRLSTHQSTQPQTLRTTNTPAGKDTNQVQCRYHIVATGPGKGSPSRWGRDRQTVPAPAQTTACTAQIQATPARTPTPHPDPSTQRPPSSSGEGAMYKRCTASGKHPGPASPTTAPTTSKTHHINWEPGSFKDLD
ncbi:hypothetical protein CHARACLAT_023984 [Characodon lateralis]|uniref:Uncharacterized protein n=1 Tax=Characodon lateralis TaxID=208331 RepID=A0ABU7E774_9TELE|nr:hypothetical protein [Characodon lateralis]